jgi:2-dehydropantoate 2-reductase
MRIAVLGAGAMGSLIGALLSGTHDVTLIGRKPHIDAVNERGLKITGLREFTCHPSAVYEVREADSPDILVLAVKAFDTDAALLDIELLSGDGTVVVSIQNGLDNHFLLSERVPRAVSCLTSLGATVIGPGEVRFAGRGETVLGSLSRRTEEAEMVAQAFNAAGVDCRLSTNIAPEIWLKVIVNSCINPITALVRRENECLREPPLREVAEGICQEAVRVAESWGVQLPTDDPFSHVMGVVEGTAANRSSMLQDLDRGKQTEIDYINGSITIKGEEKGVSSPINRALWNLIKGSSP